MSQTYVAYCNSNGETECSGNLYVSTIVQCKGCIDNSSFDTFTTQKKIQKQTGVSSSTYNNNLVPYQVTKAQHNYINQLNGKGVSQASDRNNSSAAKMQIINRNTSSLRGSRTSLKPGSLAPPINGVDVKHGSYDRHLAKLKAKSLKPLSLNINPDLLNNSKKNNISIFNYGNYTNHQCNLQLC